MNRETTPDTAVEPPAFDRVTNQRSRLPAGEPSPMTEGYAYAMGADCARNGPDETNCHFTIFSLPKFTAAWERGKRNAINSSIAHRHQRAGTARSLPKPTP